MTLRWPPIPKTTSGSDYLAQVSDDSLKVTLTDCVTELARRGWDVSVRTRSGMSERDANPDHKIDIRKEVKL